MKSLIKNYINLLTTDKINDFCIKNNIYLNNNELEFLLDLVKNNYEDIIINEQKYLDLIKNKFSNDNYNKIKDLFLYYKNRYQEYLF